MVPISPKSQGCSKQFFELLLPPLNYCNDESLLPTCEVLETNECYHESQMTTKF